MDKTEIKGNLFIIGSVFIWSFFPVLSKMSIGIVSPLTSYFYSLIFATIPFLFLFFYNKRSKEILNLDVIKDSFLSAFWIGLIFYGLYFIALNVTKAGNASIVALAEILWNYLIFNLWRKEYLRSRYILGAIFMLIGVIIVSIPKSTGWFIGDFILLIATIFTPFGNAAQKRAREKASSETVLLLRMVFTMIMIGTVMLFMKESFSVDLRGSSFAFIVLNGLMTLGISKIFWLEGIFRISITKASAISAITPFLTLLFSNLLLKEIPTIWQFVSMVPIVFGMILLTTNISLRPKANQ